MDINLKGQVAGIIISLIFGSIGLLAFGYGKKNSEYQPMVIGIVLMVYPYFVSQVWAMTGIGIALIAALFIWRD